MDKRTLLAFGLIFVVIIGWSKIYNSIYGPPESSGAADSTLVETAPAFAEADPIEAAATDTPVETIAADTPPVDPGTPASTEPRTPEDYLSFDAPGIAAEAIVVETPLYRLEIDPAGGRVARWSGREYLGPLGEADVELIPVADGPVMGDLVFFQRADLDLNRAHYVVEGSSHLLLEDPARPRDLVLTAETRGGLLIRKIFTFYPGRYDIDVALEVGGLEGAGPWVGEPQRARFGWGGGIAHTEENRDWEARNFRSFAKVGDDLVFKKRSDLSKGVEKVTENLQGSVRFAGVQNKYFHIAGLVPGAGDDRVVEGRIGLGGVPEANIQTWWLELPLRRDDDRQMSGEGLSAHIRLYIGPSRSESLRAMNSGLEDTMELGFRIFRPLAVLLLSGMHWMHRWISNYGLIIVIFSVLTRLLLYPLTQSSTKSMKKMAELQPKLKEIQAKYKDNKEKASQETMKLYKEEKVNPLGGCMPLLLQSPIFIALYQVLSNDIALRQMPFMLWIDDLAQPDTLFTMPFALPHFGADFHLLPFFMAAGMYFQSKVTPTTAGSGGQMAMMTTLMPVMMLVFFYNMPSGLVIYWTITTLMQLLQSWRIKTQTPATGGAQ